MKNDSSGFETQASCNANFLDLTRDAKFFYLFFPNIGPKKAIVVGTFGPPAVILIVINLARDANFVALFAAVTGAESTD